MKQRYRRFNDQHELLAVGDFLARQPTGQSAFAREMLLAVREKVAAVWLHT
jgi:hypothetical protein